MGEKFEVEVPDVPDTPPPGPLMLDDGQELPQPGPLDEAKRNYTLEEVAKLHRIGQRVESQFSPSEVKAEIVRQIQERVSRK